jgi:hypothetical protein
MSIARELFLEVPPLRTAAGDDAYDKLSRAAELWREDGQHFSAAVCMLDASDAAWGRPDRMLEAIRAAVADFERVVSEQSSSSPSVNRCAVQTLSILESPFTVVQRRPRYSLNPRPGVELRAGPTIIEKLQRLRACG